MDKDSRDRHLEQKRREQANRRQRAADRLRRYEERPRERSLTVGSTAVEHPNVVEDRGAESHSRESLESRRTRHKQSFVRSEVFDLESEWLAFGHDTIGRSDMTLAGIGKDLIHLGRTVHLWADRPLSRGELPERNREMTDVKARLQLLRRRLDDAHAAEVLIGDGRKALARDQLGAVRLERLAELTSNSRHIERAGELRITPRAFIRHELITKLSRRRAKRDWGGGTSDTDDWRWEGGG